MIVEKNKKVKIDRNVHGELMSSILPHMSDNSDYTYHILNLNSDIKNAWDVSSYINGKDEAESFIKLQAELTKEEKIDRKNRLISYATMYMSERENSSSK